MRRFPVDVTVCVDGRTNDYNMRRLLRELVVTMMRTQDVRLCLPTGASVELGDDDPIEWVKHEPMRVSHEVPDDPFGIWTCRMVVVLPDHRPKYTLSAVANEWKTVFEHERGVAMFRCEAPPAPGDPFAAPL
ncbi:MAG: hypothetical protein ABIG66_03570 [Candidatus Kerfeldbacteria bacterium]